MTEQPFYGGLAMSLRDVIDLSIPSAATDGNSIRWNPDFVDTLTNEELRFVLLHETLHCAHQHLWRLPADQRGNIAGDHEINLTLQQISGIKMPADGLADPQYRGMACEEILARLPDDEEQEGASDPCGTFTAPGEPEPGDGNDDKDSAGNQSSQSLKDDWEQRVVQAVQATQALGQGDVPGDMQRHLEKLRHQPVDWRRETVDFAHDVTSTRNDWSRSARRHVCQPVIYPRRRTDDIGTIIFARDTSGSITDKIASEYSALITDCVSELGCRGLVIDCDSRIQAEYDISDHEPCPLTAKGGGGTDFRPVFDRAAELMALGESISGIVYLTDMYGDFPAESDIPTLWLATSDQIARFGRTVRI